MARFGWAIAVAQVLWGLSAIRHGEGAAWITGKIEGLRLFRSLRRTGSVRLPAILAASEHVIAEVQREAGFDTFWRALFRRYTPGCVTNSMPGIVVVTFNSADVIDGCLEARSLVPGAQVVVVDNASEDGTVERIAARALAKLIANAGTGASRRRESGDGAS